MSAPSSHNSTMTEFERMLNDPDFRRMFNLPLNETTGSASQSPSPTVTTPGLSDTAFLYETDVDEFNSENSSPVPRSLTTREASSVTYGLINSALEREPDSMKKTMVSKGTMTSTPIKMVSTGTMPQTPIRPMATTKTSFSVLDNEAIVLSSPTPSFIDLVTPTTETIDLCSPGTPTNSLQ